MNHIILPRLVSVVLLMTVLPAHAAYTEEWLGARPTRQTAEASAHSAAPRKPVAHKPVARKSAPPAEAADPIADLITRRTHPVKRAAPVKPATGGHG